MPVDKTISTWHTDGPFPEGVFRPHRALQAVMDACSWQALTQTAIDCSHKSRGGITSRQEMPAPAAQDAAHDSADVAGTHRTCNETSSSCASLNRPRLEKGPGAPLSG